MKYTCKIKEGNDQYNRLVQILKNGITIGEGKNVLKAYQDAHHYLDQNFIGDIIVHISNYNIGDVVNRKDAYIEEIEKLYEFFNDELQKPPYNIMDYYEVEL